MGVLISSQSIETHKVNFCDLLDMMFEIHCAIRVSLEFLGNSMCNVCKVAKVRKITQFVMSLQILTVKDRPITTTRARKQFVWFWVHCAKTVEYIRGPEPSHLICIVFFC